LGWFQPAERACFGSALEREFDGDRAVAGGRLRRQVHPREGTTTELAAQGEVAEALARLRPPGRRARIREGCRARATYWCAASKRRSEER